MTQASPDPPVRFAGISLDCADPLELADFYVRLLGGRLLASRPDSALVHVPPGLALVMQRVADYQPPVWPGTSIVHLDLTAGGELREPEQRAIALGARPVQPQPDPRWVVLLDPAGHPFCITTITSTGPAPPRDVPAVDHSASGGHVTNGRSMEAEIRDILTTAVTQPAPAEDLFTTLLNRFQEIGGVDLPVPARTSPARAATFPE